MNLSTTNGVTVIPATETVSYTGQSALNTRVVLPNTMMGSCVDQACEEIADQSVGIQISNLRSVQQNT